MSANNLGLLAASYAARGWRVFPVLPPNKDGSCPCPNPSCTKAGKHPAIAAWQVSATTDLATIQAWWKTNPDYNIGIATGSQSNLLVLDADGTTGLLSIEERGLRETPPSVRTGRVDGGTHFYFTCPTGIYVKNFVGKVPGLDVRGEGGYVVGAGSRHKTGAIYVWSNSPDDYDLPSPPAWLMDLLHEGNNGNGAGNSDIAQGDRNNTLFHFATALRRKGMSIEAVHEECRIINIGFRPPLEEYEVKTIAESACREEYAHAPDYEIHLHDQDLVYPIIVNATYLRELPWTEMGSAEAFARAFGGQFCYVNEWKKWVRWNGSVWTLDTASAVNRSIAWIIRARRLSSVYIADTDERESLERWAIKQETSGHIDTTLKRAQSLDPLVETPMAFDTNKALLGMTGRTWNLETHTSKPPDPLDKITLSVAPKYDAEATCPLWEKTLMEVFLDDKDMVDFFQRAIGYSTTGETVEQCLFICHGFGANGKSTLLSAIRNVLGEYAATARYETFDTGKASTKGDDLAKLRGKRFVLVVEPDADMKFAEGKIKQITGGEDLITCRALYGEDFSYQPEFKLWMSLNHKPRISGTDAGIWRRIRLIPFMASFSDNTTRNRYLSEELKPEYPGILNWILEGVRLWREIGLQPPAGVIEATNLYQQESDVFGLWREECTVEGPDVEDTQNSLYLAYTTWCKQNNHRPITGNMFGRQLTERKYIKGLNKQRKTVYKGIRAIEFGGFDG